MTTFALFIAQQAAWSGRVRGMASTKGDVLQLESWREVSVMKRHFVRRLVKLVVLAVPVAMFAFSFGGGHFP